MNGAEVMTAYGRRRKHQGPYRGGHPGIGKKKPPSFEEQIGPRPSPQGPIQALRQGPYAGAHPGIGKGQHHKHGPTRALGPHGGSGSGLSQHIPDPNYRPKNHKSKRIPYR